MTPGHDAKVIQTVAATAGTALHFAMLPGNETAFLAYLNENRPAGEQITPELLRRLMCLVHDIVAPDCDEPIEAM
jgi:hypothetical protein